MAVVRRLRINGIDLPIMMTTDSFSQTYEDIGGRTLLRTLNGAAIKETRWTRLRTVLSGGGGIPAVLNSLDYSQSFTLGCVAKRAVHSSTTTVTLPSSRRTDTDYTPLGYASVSGFLQPTSISIVGDTATLGAVSGADHYIVHYWPLLTVFSDGPQETTDPHGATYAWSMTCEEI